MKRIKRMRDNRFNMFDSRINAIYTTSSWSMVTENVHKYNSLDGGFLTSYSYAVNTYTQGRQRHRTAVPLEVIEVGRRCDRMLDKTIWGTDAERHWNSWHAAIYTGADEIL
jgi:hypothetical protein